MICCNRRDAGDMPHQTLKSFVEPYLATKIIGETMADLTEELEAVFEDVCTAARNDGSLRRRCFRKRGYLAGRKAAPLAYAGALAAL